MVSFQQKLAHGLIQRGIQVCYDLEDFPYESILVIGGTRQLSGLRAARGRGTRIVQRLNGMNWLHRARFRKERRGSLRHFVRSEYGNLLLSYTRKRLVDAVIYQSVFAKQWWERVYGVTPVGNSVIYNGVDLNEYSPDGRNERPQEHWRLLMVEGSLMGGYEIGLETAVQLGLKLCDLLKRPGASRFNKPVELVVVGRVSLETQAAWDKRLPENGCFKLTWKGLVPGERVPEIDRSAHILFSADINAACPNSVIEAMACGLPVVAFDTGALPELVCDGAGEIVPYAGNPWNLDTPDTPALAFVALQVLERQESFRQAARKRAQAAFGLDEMVESYLQVLINA